MAEPLPRIVRIEIDGLFRRYKHRIDLNLADRVTILHGGNGTGKTTVLELIDALFKGDIARLSKPPFNTFIVTMSDGSCMGVARNDGGAFMALNPDVWGWNYDSGNYANPKDLDDWLRRVPIVYIRDQRLFALQRAWPEQDSESEVIPMVRAIATEMVKIIGESDDLYKSTSVRLDDSLPNRLFGTKRRPVVDTAALIKRYERLDGERARLRELGLLTDKPSAFDIHQIEPSELAILAVYLDDNEEKLGVFRTLADKAELVLRHLNRKLAPKRIMLDKDLGYRAFCHDGEPLSIEALSSGEQHELVMLHTVVFRVPEGALLLIDEPELSLHIAWQEQLLDEFIAIAKLGKFDVLMATHSPYIVGERHDLLVQLGAPE